MFVALQILGTSSVELSIDKALFGK
ncbi:hypothetical protein D018_3218B, partial [Vibrio parahaemolyticus VP2007-007]